MPGKKLSYIPREISWLSFNGRVLQEAADSENPLIERLKFLGIFSNNLDEFFRVRVATLTRIAKLEKKKENPANDTQKILKKIAAIIATQQNQFLEIYSDILKQLEKHKIYFVNEQQLTPEQGLFVKDYYEKVLRSNLFPLMLKTLSDISKLRDKSLYLAIHLKNTSEKKKNNYALIELPDKVSRFLQLPTVQGRKTLIMIDDVIRYCLPDIFSMFNYDEFHAYTIKFTRDAELDIDSDVSKSFLEHITKSIKQRKEGKPIRLIYDDTIPDNLLTMLSTMLDITKKEALLPGGRYHNFRDFMSFPRIGPASLVHAEPTSKTHEKLRSVKNIFPVIRQQDLMLHFPYQSFGSIIDLLREAAIDPKVEEIKITIYRVAHNSRVMSALINAARNGKKVTVLMELQARFDEENNIFWTGKLQEEGVKIIQSSSGFKVHAKLLLITRKEGGTNRLYANIGTGNFNEDTARVYADDSLLTCDPRITHEVAMVFELIEFHYKSYKFNHLILSPFNMRDHFIKLLNNEIRAAKKGQEAWAILKMNSLADEKIAAKIHEAACNGVKIRLIIRGTCILSPDPKITHGNIEAISIVDQYLEHSRVFIFGNQGDPLYYITSADWMVRNFDYRIEVACPIYDVTIQNELKSMLELQMKDNVKARNLDKGQKNNYRTSDEPAACRSQLEMHKLFD